MDTLIAPAPSQKQEESSAKGILPASSPRRMNFIPRMRENKKQSARINPYILVVAGLAAIVLIVALVLTYSYHFVLTPQYEQVTSALDDPAFNADYEKVFTVQGEIDALRAADKGLSLAIANIESYPRMDKSIFDVVSYYAGVDIEVNSYAYSESNGLLQLTCTSETALDASGYAEKLRLSGTFEDVLFYGYIRESIIVNLELYDLEELSAALEAGGEAAESLEPVTETEETGIYHFMVICKLKGGGDNEKAD